MLINLKTVNEHANRGTDIVFTLMTDSIPASHALMFANLTSCLDSKTADERETYARIYALAAAELRQSGLATEQYSTLKVQRELLTLELRQKSHDFEMKLKAFCEAKSQKPTSTDSTEPPEEAS